MPLFANCIGIVGVILVMIAYFFLETGHLDAHHFTYPTLNLIGSLLILVSLYYAWNLPSFLMEFVWALISIFGLYQAKKKRSTSPP
jgi:hypothetical protein